MIAFATGFAIFGIAFASDSYFARKSAQREYLKVKKSIDMCRAFIEADKAAKLNRIATLERQLAKAKRRAEKERNKRIWRSMQLSTPDSKNEQIRTANLMNNVSMNLAMARMLCDQGSIYARKKSARKSLAILRYRKPFPLP